MFIRPAISRILLLAVIIALTVVGCGGSSTPKRHRASMAECGKIKQSTKYTACLGRRFDSLMQREGLTAAIKTIDARAEKSRRFFLTCHMAWHQVSEPMGRRAAQAHKPAVPPVRGGSFCTQGFEHGYYIGYLSTSPRSTDIASAARSMCLTKREQAAILGCVHAVGHAVARKSNVTDSTRACDTLRFDDVKWKPQTTLTPRVRFECDYGVFMEYALTIDDIDEATAQRCTDAPAGMAAGACYSYLPQKIRQMDGDDDEVAASCNAATDAMLHAFCVYNVIAVLASADCTMFPIERSRAVCQEIVHERLSGDVLIARVGAAASRRRHPQAGAS